MQGHQKDALPILFWFGMTVVFVDHNADLGGHCVTVAALLWLIAWVSTRVIGNAMTQLGSKGWQVFTLMVAGFGLFLWLAPLPLGVRIFAAWGIGLPLVLLGTGARYVHDWLTARHTPLGTHLLEVAGGTFVVFPPLFWWNGTGFLAGVIVAALLSSGLVAFFFGWQLGERVRADDRDARFADADDFRRSGVSHDL
jgi:hypothetical protein